MLRGERLAPAVLAQPIEPGSGKQCRIGLARRQFGQPRRDIAAKWDDGAVLAQIEQLCGAARCAGADPGAARQRGNRGRADQDIAHIFARQDCGESDVRRADGLDILGRMHREIDLAGQQRGIELLGPQRLAADFGQRAVLIAVAAGQQWDQHHIASFQPMRRNQPCARFFGLNQCKGRAASAEAQGVGDLVKWHGRLC